ncbi:uncharacterized protein LOC130724316 [Lotus japonicus]|uniref:uncharacterized protein LOC130724316 n=1 Tax=Lotus japonicus TaxID=34305 RepID=UPI00258E40AA|nr:uncharacterized protein LOC130724316 [Lotus japonicus]
MARNNKDQWVLSGSEAEVLNVGPVTMDPVLAADVWAVGRLISEPALITRVFRSVLGRLWGSQNHVEIREVSNNLFLFRFVNTRERNFAVQGGPWYVNRFLVVMAKFDVNSIPSQVTLVRVPFWVRVYNLRVSLRTAAVVRSLGSTFAGLITWDRAEIHRFREYMRIRVWVDVTKPLRRGQAMKAEDGASFQVRFRYEKLFNYCYKCGMMDHVVRDCAEMGEQDNGAMLYGAWLRADEEYGDGGRYRRDFTGPSKEKNAEFWGSKTHVGSSSKSMEENGAVGKRDDPVDTELDKDDLLFDEDHAKKQAAQYMSKVNKFTNATVHGPMKENLGTSSLSGKGKYAAETVEGMDDDEIGDDDLFYDEDEPHEDGVHHMQRRIHRLATLGLCPGSGHKKNFFLWPRSYFGPQKNKKKRAKLRETESEAW